MEIYKEKPMSLYQADLIELGAEYLIYHVEGWMFKHGKDVSEDVHNFIAWCREEDKEMMHCKRGRDRKSFYERREEAKKEEAKTYET
jgi:hypothetical protein